MTEENNQKLLEINISEKAIVCSNWCILCWPNKEYAQVVYHGNSLCIKCFERKLNKEREASESRAKCVERIMEWNRILEK